MLAAGIDQRGYRLAFNNIDAPTLQWEANIREIVHREREFQLAVEPHFHRAPIVGRDDSHVARLQRTQMGIDNFRGGFGLIVLAGPGTHPPSYKCDKEDGGCGSEPVPGSRLRYSEHGRLGAQISANLLPEQGGRMLIKLGASQRVSNRIADPEFCDTNGAMFEVAFEFGNTVGAQLSVKISVKHGTTKVTTHA
jgi:hypothetical protein